MSPADAPPVGVPAPRRSLLTTGMAAFCLYAFLREARAAAPGDRRLPARRWIDRQDELAQGLRAGAISGLAWRDAVEQLAREVDATQLLAEIHAAKSTPAGPPFRRDPVKRNVEFLDQHGRPRRLGYAAATFTFGPDSVITPHAHRHMASAHMVIEGRVRIRTFDRLAEAGGALLIRPTGDHVAGVGQAAAMTTAKDNVHWFTPATARAATFDVIVSGLDPGQASYAIEPVDPLGGQHRPDGTILAPFLSFDQSMDRYTASI